ncbi:hypothetical protein DBT_0799 [Dissulfuribacter thermophilus]|uniref:Uncharacterized protein n=1 Tax=Dissulfuribacter thermophilus TaxID=1156395 RepID=A0A1B9F7Q0_9BACT|nr:hypothetical protein DBT_0799 [Dissulfuribacter thermophilus]
MKPIIFAAEKLFFNHASLIKDEIFVTRKIIRIVARITLGVQ